LTDFSKARSLSNIKQTLNGAGHEFVVAACAYLGLFWIVTLGMLIKLTMLYGPEKDPDAPPPEPQKPWEGYPLTFMSTIATLLFFGIYWLLWLIVMFGGMMLIIILTPSPYEEWLRCLEGSMTRTKIRSILYFIRSVHPLQFGLIWLYAGIRYKTSRDFRLEKDSDWEFHEIWIVYSFWILWTIGFLLRLLTQSWAEWYSMISFGSKAIIYDYKRLWELLLSRKHTILGEGVSGLPEEQNTSPTDENRPQNKPSYIIQFFHSLKSGSRRGWSLGPKVAKSIYRTINFLSNPFLNRESRSLNSHLPGTIQLDENEESQLLPISRQLTNNSETQASHAVRYRIWSSNWDLGGPQCF
jgi:hypothetical protein